MLRMDAPAGSASHSTAGTTNRAMVLSFLITMGTS